MKTSLQWGLQVQGAGAHQQNSDNEMADAPTADRDPRAVPAVAGGEPPKPSHCLQADFRQQPTPLLLLLLLLAHLASLGRLLP